MSLSSSSSSFDMDSLLSHQQQYIDRLAFLSSSPSSSSYSLPLPSHNEDRHDDHDAHLDPMVISVDDHHQNENHYAHDNDHQRQFIPPSSPLSDLLRRMDHVMTMNENDKSSLSSSEAESLRIIHSFPTTSTSSSSSSLLLSPHNIQIKNKNNNFSNKKSPSRTLSSPSSPPLSHSVPSPNFSSPLPHHRLSTAKSSTKGKKINILSLSPLSFPPTFSPSTDKKNDAKPRGKKSQNHHSQYQFQSPIRTFSPAPVPSSFSPSPHSSLPQSPSSISSSSSPSLPPTLSSCHNLITHLQSHITTLTTTHQSTITTLTDKIKVLENTLLSLNMGRLRYDMTLREKEKMVDNMGKEMGVIRDKKREMEILYHKSDMEREMEKERNKHLLIEINTNHNIIRNQKAEIDQLSSSLHEYHILKSHHSTLLTTLSNMEKTVILKEKAWEKEKGKWSEMLTAREDEGRREGERRERKYEELKEMMMRGGGNGGIGAETLYSVHQHGDSKENAPSVIFPSHSSIHHQSLPSDSTSHPPSSTLLHLHNVIPPPYQPSHNINKRLEFEFNDHGHDSEMDRREKEKEKEKEKAVGNPMDQYSYQNLSKSLSSVINSRHHYSHHSHMNTIDDDHHHFIQPKPIFPDEEKEGEKEEGK